MWPAVITAAKSTRSAGTTGNKLYQYSAPIPVLYNHSTEPTAWAVNVLPSAVKKTELYSRYAMIMGISQNSAYGAAIIPCGCITKRIMHSAGMKDRAMRDSNAQ